MNQDVGNEPEQHGLTREGLRALHETAAQLNSTTLLIAHDGVVVSEWCAPNFKADARQANLYSVTKSVTSTLFGIAVDRGLLAIDEPASKYIPSWVGTASEAVTIRNLLSNDSGRSWSMETDYGQLLFGADQTNYAIKLAQAVPPGTHWEYNNAAIQTLEAVLHKATGVDVETFAQQHLFGPLGISANLTRDERGNPLVYQGISTSCRDIARFGGLFAQAGEWEGQQIVSKDWVAEATRPNSTLNSAYGLMWWLNREGHVVEPSFPDRMEYPGRLVPGSCEQLFTAIGAFGQFVIVDPVDRYVIVRLQDITDLEAAMASDPDPVGIRKLNTLMTSFEAAKR